MGGALGKITKVIKKVDPLRGGDVLLEKAGLPTLTGEGDKNIFDMGGGQEGAQTGQPLGQPVAPATVDEARQNAERNDILRRRRGRASTILTGNQGDTSTVNVGTKTLLGG